MLASKREIIEISLFLCAALHSFIHHGQFDAAIVLVVIILCVAIVNGLMVFFSLLMSSCARLIFCLSVSAVCKIIPWNFNRNIGYLMTWCIRSEMSRCRFVFKYETVCEWVSVICATTTTYLNVAVAVALYASECVWRRNQIASFSFKFVLSHSLYFILVRSLAIFPVSLILSLLLPISCSIRFCFFALYTLA